MYLKSIAININHFYYVDMYNNSKIKSLIGANVKIMRTKLNITQEQLAEALEVQMQTIAKIETGKLFISSEMLAKFCNYFKITPTLLFSENLRIIHDENVCYLSKINTLLPSFDDSRLKDIYNILLALKK